MIDQPLSDEQKQYLSGFAAGSGLSLKVLPTFAGTLGLSAEQLPGGGRAPRESAASVPESDPLKILYDAQDATMAAGGKLVNEEKAKRDIFPLDQWEDIRKHAAEGAPPKGTDLLAFKYHGLFWVAPNQVAYMCRLRLPGGVMESYQLRGVAQLADDYGGGYADVTTRANLQIREIAPEHADVLVERLADLGILIRGSGADNIRNVTGSPLAGVDPQELADTRPLSRAMHHYILNHREMYGLPRKFNIAFDGGGAISALEDTNDIGFSAVRVGDGKAAPAGVYYRLVLGGITGHEDFARDTGVHLKPDECVPAAAAIVRAFIEHGDRTDRKKARLKYVLDRMGFDGFLKEVEKYYGAPLPRLPLEACEPRPAIQKRAHIGFFPQKQAGLNYVGVVLPVGRMTADQMRGLAKIADVYGSGSIRLTVWQNLVITDIPAEQIDAAKNAIEALGLGTSATSVRGGLIACTGNAGCRYANSNTKSHALQISDFLGDRLELDVPVNVHLTGCPNSCAQHYIGDIGLLGTKVAVSEDEDAELVEGYHVFVGGGYGPEQDVGRQLYASVPANDCPPTVERMLRGYLTHRASRDESFREFVKRFPAEELKALFETAGEPVEV